ncbi:hypothetical protein SNOG_09122 [Parastagonospora nodorum SN15]|uniref:Uncharacterized protein n=1 Tax=Phaeosphaeria nodorum (strain SN15 / ATCC MYA-4574 / FGSC 10173) TaxID=321614 RepID=Q0UGJ2_PHANO|nr:hypothetical protein SNOG_09122 [Parastagonospora nodorum SN15]EAT83314.1 hypothetical protein SNOG_09122 [Parastagonospora nodorum SN15]
MDVAVCKDDESRLPRQPPASKSCFQPPSQPLVSQLLCCTASPRPPFV